MGKVVTAEVKRLANQQRIQVVDANVLVLGLAFKENCSVLRTTTVLSIVRDLEARDAHLAVSDPWVNPEDAAKEFGFPLTMELRDRHYDAVIVAVAPTQSRETGIDRIRQQSKRQSVILDAKYLFRRSEADRRL